MRFRVPLFVLLGLSASAIAQTGGHAPKGMTDEAGLPLLAAGTIDMYSPAAVRVVAAHGEEQRLGTGFFIGPGRLVTSRRLLFGSTSAQLVFETGETFAIKRITAEDVEAGIVVASLEVPAELRRGLRVSFLSPLIGDVGIAIGMPTEPVVDPPKHEMVGIKLAASAAKGDLKLIRLEPMSEVADDVWSRLDGGPVIDTYGQVVGVVSVEHASETKPMVAVGGVVLHKLVETEGMALGRWSSEGSLASVIAAEKERASARQASDIARPSDYPAAPKGLEGFAVVPASIEKREEGGFVFDGRYELLGSGTRTDPYIVSWDLLVSSSETMMPRVGKRTIPERIAMLDGKWVLIGGNISFPLMMNEPTELLLMLNPWDGCCIGVPPTPYDAVEVGLNEPATDEDVYAAYGAVTGRLLVRPYLVGDWLVGMYVLEDARLSVEDRGGGLR
jgi:hypothetical protein